VTCVKRGDATSRKDDRLVVAHQETSTTTPFMVRPIAVNQGFRSFLRAPQIRIGFFIRGTLSITQVRRLAEHEAYINIENVVASATLNQKMDLNSIVRIFPGVEYRPEQFPGLVYRLKKPKTATLIFSSGKMVCTGAKSERLARKAIMKVVDELKRGGIVILAKPEIQVQNIVASAGLGGRIDLEKTTYSLKRTMYEPEQFPGLIYRMDDPKVVILIFASGKLVCTGAKKEAEVPRAIAKLQAALEEKGLITY
jgi:transcription initiation factor TFIID TATA-box-binding protein